jgi:potassium efflux system protein
MKSYSRWLHIIILFLLSLILGTAFAADPPALTGSPSTVVTSEILEVKIAEVEAATDLPETAKTKLTELYRKALSELEATRAGNAAAEAFRAAAVAAPQDTQVTRKKYEQAQQTTPEESLALTADTPLTEIEPLLQKEHADLAAAEAKLAGLDQQLENEATRPNAVQQRLTKARQQQEQIAAEIGLPSPPDELPALTEARQWVLATREQALQAEIGRLDAELRSQPLRVELLNARQELVAHNVRQVRARVRLLEVAVNQRRQTDLTSVQDETEAALREFAGKHPVLVRFARENAQLAEKLTATARQLELLSARDDEIDNLTTRIEQEFKNAREALKITGLSQAFGQVLQEQRRALPDLRSFHRQIRDREALIAEFGLRRMQHREDYRKLRDLDAYAGEVLTDVESREVGQISSELQQLLERRHQLTGKLLALEENVLRELGLAEVDQRHLIEIVKIYDDFLAEHLLWVRTTNQAGLGDFGALPGELARFISPSSWLEVTRVLLYQALRSPIFALVILVFGILMWKRKWMIAALQATGEKLGKPTTDSFALTARAVVLTLLAAAPWPLLATGAGWQLHHSLQGTGFTSTIGLALIAVSAEFYFLQFSRALCLPCGLAARHFRWPEASLQLLRHQLGRLLWTFLPAGFVTHVAINLDPVTVGGVIGRLSFVIIALALGMFFFHVLHPRRGVLVDFVQHARKQPLGWIHQLWFPLMVIIPAILVILALAGYLYTAGSLIMHLIETTWLIFGLILLNGLAVRWLMVTRRKLAYEAALEQRKAAREAEQKKESTPGTEGSIIIDIEEPEVDLVALSEESRKLLNTTLVFTGIIGLWLIWSEVLPALRFLDNVSLWHYTVTVDNETQRFPITLADLGLAILIGIGTYVLAKRLPSVLEIVLLNRFKVSAGGRYTVITLMTYVIVAIGILLALNTIGARWSQLQWLVAALGVGIGFGLQEIVANFICGLILLVERPVRVGDLITVGDASGKVMRIRIRATTIRDFEQKELLIPNKELITGRLLNWTLSDEMTRILIQVGIAYGSDVDKAMEILLELAHEDERVLEEPPPGVVFDQFADSSLNLGFRVFVGTLADRLPVMTDMHRKIHRRFAEEGITIAFPQRDVHIHAGDMPAAMPGGKGANGDVPAQ